MASGPLTPTVPSPGCPLRAGRIRGFRCEHQEDRRASSTRCIARWALGLPSETGAQATPVPFARIGRCGRRDAILTVSPSDTGVDAGRFDVVS